MYEADQTNLDVIAAIGGLPPWDEADPRTRENFRVNARAVIGAGLACDRLPAKVGDRRVSPDGCRAIMTVHGGLARCQLPKWHTSQCYNPSAHVAVFRDREAARGVQ